MFKLYLLIYNILIYLMQPFICARLLWNSKRVPLYRQNYLERFGIYQNKKIKSNGIIVHAVSLGETLLAKLLVSEIKKHYPDIVITLTSMTPSGLTEAYRLQSIYHHIQCIYLPYDLPCAMKRLINTIKPTLVIIMETELWPNLINTVYQHNTPLILANARLSYCSFMKYKKIKYFLVHILKRITVIAAQYQEDANRFIKLGFNKNNYLYIIGNLKFDFTITEDLLKKNFY